MAKKICVECLSEYEICIPCEERYSKEMFAWRILCCSYRCAMNYFARTENEDKANEPLNKVAENIRINTTEKRGCIMQVLTHDNKTYDVLEVDNKRGILTLKNTEKVIKIDEIVEILYVKVEDIVKLNELIVSSKKKQEKSVEVDVKEQK